MTHVLEDEFDDPGEAVDPNAVKRDRWDRPLLPPVNTALTRAEGDVRPFTRCTTFAKTLGNESNLTAWKMRLVAKGMAEREDLRLLARSTEVTDKAGLNEVADAAFELAGGNAGRRLGTAFHNFSEIRDRGGSDDDIDPEFLPHVEAYSAALKVHGIEIMPDYIERLCAWEKFSVSGSFDNIVMWKRPGEDIARPTVLDKKGGADLSYSWLSIVVQLFCYASADGIWDQENYRWLPMPEGLRTDVALVAHVPTGKRGEEVVCDIYEIDLLPTAEACRISYEARDWLKTRGLAMKLKAKPLSAQIEVLADTAKPKRGRPRKKVEPVVEVLQGAALDAEVKASGVPIGRCTYCGNEHIEMTCPEAPKDDTWVWPWAKPEDITVEVTTTETEIVADVGLIVEDDDPFGDTESFAMTPEEEYRLRIMDASSPVELSVIRKEAMDSGTWNDALLELGMARLAELKK